MTVSRQKHTTRGVVAQARAFLAAAEIVAAAYPGAPVDYSVMREGPYKDWSLRRAAQHVSCPVPTELPDGRILVAYWFCAKEQNEPIENVQIVRHIAGSFFSSSYAGEVKVFNSGTENDPAGQIYHAHAFPCEGVWVGLFQWYWEVNDPWGEMVLFEALADGKIAGAGLDVFAEEPPGPKVGERFDRVVSVVRKVQVK